MALEPSSNCNKGTHTNKVNALPCICSRRRHIRLTCSASSVLSVLLLSCGAGCVSTEQVQDKHGIQDREAEGKLADELSTEILPAQVLLVAAGDVIADNGLFLYH